MSTDHSQTAAAGQPLDRRTLRDRFGGRTDAEISEAAEPYGGLLALIRTLLNDLAERCIEEVARDQVFVYDLR